MAGMIDVTNSDFSQLERYLGDEFDLSWCGSGDEKVHTDAIRYDTNDEFARNTLVFCYQNIGVMMQGIHRPYIARLLEMTTDWPAPSLIDVFAGGGQMGLALHTLGFRVSFADIASRSLDWLKWRLNERQLDLPVYNWDEQTDEIPQHDFVVCFDALEHLAPDDRHDLLERLSKIGRIVMVNLIVDHRPEMAGVHLETNPQEIIAWIQERWKAVAWPFYPDQDGEPRQWLVIYGEGVKEVE
jgi:2-polyprenyl-3-methyl-5-hydroxy-6-metoxy-1,4-benzoquinol methylase